MHMIFPFPRLTWPCLPASLLLLLLASASTHATADTQVNQPSLPLGEADDVFTIGERSAERIEITLTLELAPRLVNEQILLLGTDRRTLTYKRIIRLPEMLRAEEEDLPVAVIPKAPAAGAAGTTADGKTKVGGGAGGNGRNSTTITTTGSGDGGNPFGPGGGGGGGPGGSPMGGGG